MYPGTVSIGEIYAADGAAAIWSSYIRYIGAGMVAAGGIISLVKSLPLIVTTFLDAMKEMKEAGNKGSDRTDTDLDMKLVTGGIALMVIATLLFATFILKRSLQSRTAATRIEDVDLYKIQMNRKKSTDLISL